ncbi:DUF2145 domain-containing protein [Ideonella sp. A 288]|uniref:DUF2145 domain-containing protein n=1 Tax=Ideonella sp. A 288 TaxID=1962181 RepID=UPI000B4B47BA|nr:DUF2145 domain-containing protein [Ideonella sp. A 288]
MRALWLAALLGACAVSGMARAASLQLCSAAPTLTATQQDRLLRFSAIVRRELEASGESVALVARSGLALGRFGVRFTHAGISLKASPNGPWSVRQLYFACAEGRPRLYDQGMAGFVFGTDDPALGHVSIVLLPPAEADALQRAALDTPLALRLLAGTYSANAHAHSLRYQNCNQWVVELLATAWGGPGIDAGHPQADADSAPRGRAQRWLAAQGYAPQPIELGSHPMMAAAGFVPWLYFDDHPPDDLFALRFRTTMPASIEAFVRAHVPGARRLELCHDGRQVVIHHGWEPVAEGCRPGEGDRVAALD